MLLRAQPVAAFDPPGLVFYILNGTRLLLDRAAPTALLYFPSSDLDADWVPVASGSAADAVIALGSAASTLWVTTLGAGERRELPEAPYAHLFVAVGEVDLEEVGVLSEGDALRVTDRAALRITGRRPSELLVWGMG